MLKNGAECHPRTSLKRGSDLPDFVSAEYLIGVERGWICDWESENRGKPVARFWDKIQMLDSVYTHDSLGETQTYDLIGVHEIP